MNCLITLRKLLVVMVIAAPTLSATELNQISAQDAWNQLRMQDDKIAAGQGRSTKSSGTLVIER
ncbi:MAG: hypothetical protein LRY63_12880 [Nitrincola sp.]|nr:hypothetical protein [Nitrincola sp.]